MCVCVCCTASVLEDLLGSSGTASLVRPLEAPDGTSGTSEQKQQSAERRTEEESDYEERVIGSPGSRWRSGSPQAPPSSSLQTQISSTLTGRKGRRRRRSRSFCPFHPDDRSPPEEGEPEGKAKSGGRAGGKGGGGRGQRRGGG